MLNILPFKSDPVIFGVLALTLGIVFYTSGHNHPLLKKWYKYVPPLFLCYFIPALLHWPLGLIDPKESNIYHLSSKVLLPASLILMCLHVHFKGLLSLGPKAIWMLMAASLSIVMGGPVALAICLKFFPEILPSSGEEWWKGLSTIAGSWIGGGANQAAMKEIFQVSDQMFATLVVVDIALAGTWMGVLLYGVTKAQKIDQWLGAELFKPENLQSGVKGAEKVMPHVGKLNEYMTMFGVVFGGVGLAHVLADWIVPVLGNYKEYLLSLKLESLLSPFFWMIIIATTYGLLISFTPARKFENLGASKYGSIFLYLLVASIGMQMNLSDLTAYPGLLLIGLIWIICHILTLMMVARIIKAPFFYVAVASQANVGGAASAPIISSAFHPSLASVGVIMAVIGYAFGTYGAILSAWLMQWVSAL